MLELKLSTYDYGDKTNVYFRLYFQYVLVRIEIFMLLE